MKNPPQKREHAVVVGAGISGLLAARVLSEKFIQVTIMDRDQLPDEPLARRGTPQAQHIHVLLRKGWLLINELFPGLNEKLAATGAPLVDWTADSAWYTPVGWGPRFASGFTTRTCSRALLEWELRQRISSLENVNILPRLEAKDVHFNQNQLRVDGVMYRARSAGSSPTDTLQSMECDLLVDASGRSSQSNQWLSRIGFTAPEETVINAHYGYASRVMRPRTEFVSSWKVMLVRNRPPFGTAGGIIFPIENGLWMVNIGGAGDERPPTDEDGFQEFIRNLIHPAMFDAFQQAESISPIAGYQLTENRRKHYEGLANWPEGLLVMGDAMGALNPVYGQGMTKAALEAIALRSWLDQEKSALAFQKTLVKILNTPWLMATNEDLRIPGVQGGEINRMTRLIQNYLDQVQWIAAHYPPAYLKFLEVSNLVKPPQALFVPGILLKTVPRMFGKPLKPESI